MASIYHIGQHHGQSAPMWSGLGDPALPREWVSAGILSAQPQGWACTQASPQSFKEPEAFAQDAWRNSEGQSHREALRNLNLGGASTGTFGCNKRTDAPSPLPPCTFTQQIICAFKVCDKTHAFMTFRRITTQAQSQNS